MKRILITLLCFTLPVLGWANLTNTASVAYQDGSGNAYTGTSNTVTVTVTASAPPVITLTKTATPSSASSGETVTFTINYQNTGTGNASNVVITDAVPSGSTLVAGSMTGGGTLSGNTINWNVGSVAAGASGTVSFQTKVN